jgi:hypothetical protein
MRVPEFAKPAWDRVFRRRSIVGWIVFALGTIWLAYAQWSTAEFAFGKLSLVTPSLRSVWEIVSSVPAVWYQTALIVIGLSWIAFVASRPEQSETVAPTPAKRPDEVLLDFLATQRGTLQSFISEASEVENRIRVGLEVPPGVEPEYARQQKLSADYLAVDRWARMVAIHLQQHVTCANRLFAYSVEPLGDTPAVRLSEYVARLFRIISDIEMVMDYTRRRLQ